MGIIFFNDFQTSFSSIQSHECGSNRLAINNRDTDSIPRYKDIIWILLYIEHPVPIQPHECGCNEKFRIYNNEITIQLHMRGHNGS